MCLSFSICAPFLWIVFCNSHSRSRNWCTVTRYAAWLHAGSSHTLLSKQSATFILVSMLCYRWRFITKLKPWLSRNYSTIWMGPFSLLPWPHFSLPASSPFLCKYPLPGAPPSLFHLLYVIIELVKLFGEVGVKFKQIVSFTFYFLSSGFQVFLLSNWLSKLYDVAGLLQIAKIFWMCLSTSNIAL